MADYNSVAEQNGLDGEAGGKAASVLRGGGDSQTAGYVLALDVGSTVIRSHVYDRTGNIKGSSSVKLVIEQPQPGWYEIDPHKLFEDSKSVMQKSIKAAGLEPAMISCLGIATQRNSFLNWDRETGEPFHRIVSWQDLRASQTVEDWNRSLTLKLLNNGAGFAHFFTHRKRHLAASVLKFMSKQVTLRLQWVLNNIPELRERACDNKVMFGCIETWLLWKLTKGQVHATDFSCASSTGIFDPYCMEWSTIVTGLVSLPMSIFPEVRDTSGDFGSTHPDIFGVPIPIRAVVADQQSAMFSQCCFKVGDVKCTMGTGMFFDVNTGTIPHASIAGLYPLVGWKIGKETTYLVEGLAADTGSVLEWGRKIGLYEDVSDTSAMAYSVEDSGGVCFIPAFSGLQAPVNDDTAATTLMGVTVATTKAHIVRAILESLAFKFKGLYETTLSETKVPLNCIRVDGGVSNNDFLMQLVADVIDQKLECSVHTDMTSLGAAYLAGLAAGIWQSKEELLTLRKTSRTFDPQPSWPSIRPTFHLWKRALQRSLLWYR